MADRLVVDGSGWHGNGLAQIAGWPTFERRRPSRSRTSRWSASRAGGRRSRRSSTSRTSCRTSATSGAITVTYASATRRRAGDDERRQAALPRGVARPRGWGCASSKPLAPIRGAGGAPRPLETPRAGAGLARRSDWTPSRGRDPPGLSEMPPGTTLRVELRADIARLRAPRRRHRRAGRGPRPGLADGVQVLERGFSAPRRNELDLLAEAIEAGGRDPVAVGALRMAAELLGRRSRRRDRAADRDPADADACATAAARADRARRSSGRSTAAERAHWATTGGSTPAAIYRRLAAPPLRDEIPWQRVQLWWGDDRFVPADHPLSNVQLATSDLLEIGALSGESGTGGSGADVGGRGPARRSRPATPPVPRRRRDRQGGGRTGPRSATRRSSRAAGPAVRRRRPGVRPRAARRRAGRAHPVRLPGLGGVRPAGAGAPVPAPTHVEPHVPRVTLNPRIVDAAQTIVVVVHGAAKAAILATPAGRRASTSGAGRPSSPGARARPGSSTRRRLPRSAGEPRDRVRVDRLSGRRDPARHRRRRRRIADVYLDGLPRDVRVPARPHRRPGPRLARRHRRRRAPDVGRRGRRPGRRDDAPRRRRHRPALRRPGLAWPRHRQPARRAREGRATARPRAVHVQRSPSRTRSSAANGSSCAATCQARSTRRRAATSIRAASCGRRSGICATQEPQIRAASCGRRSATRGSAPRRSRN